MQITMVNYTKTFNLGNYSSEKIGVEIAINEGEDAKEALSTAKQLVEEYHQQTYSEHSHIEEKVITYSQDKFTEGIERSTDFFKSPPREQTLEEQIMSCEEIKVLESYKFIAKKDPQLQLAYDKKMYILTH